MTNLLIVPIYLDALVLDKPTAVVEAFADFSRLPYFDGQRDVNPEVPNISEEILSQPFQNQNLYLERGVHLHWAMPDALSRGRKVSDKTDFPTLPNRWLVSRIRNQIIETQWVVESDYLYPYLFSVELQYISELDTQKVSDTLSALFKQNGQTLNKATAIVIESGKKWMVIDEDQTYFISKEAGTLNIYLRSNADTDSNARIAYPASIDPYRPFGYLGRCLELKAWQNETNKSKNIYLDKLTAVGYGEPAFAAFYPNCHSVFGFWDDTATDTNGLRGAAYEVLGWYSNSDQDSLSLWTGKTLKDEVASLLESNKWQVVKPSDDDDPVQRMVCFGRINFDNSAKFDFKLTEEKNVAIAVGNTSTEALSAHLAAKLGTDKTKSIIEDQLEALHLAAGLEKRRLDIGPKFTEARHAKGFRPVPAGYIWTLRPESNQQPDQVVNQSDQVTLPPELAEHLNTLNDLQQAYDQADFEIESLRSQLFTDWYKYMLCAYPPWILPTIIQTSTK